MKIASFSFQTVLLFSLLFCFVSDIRAQKSTIGIQGGVNYSRSVGNENSYVKGNSFGIEYEHYLKTGNVYFRIKALHNEKGFVLTEQYDNKNNIILDVPITYTLSYFSLPVGMGFNFGSQLYCFVNAGLMPSYLTYVSANYEIIMPDYTINKRSYDLTTTTRQFDLSGFAEVGFGLKVNPIWVYTSAAIQPSFTTIQTPTYMELPLIETQQVSTNSFIFSVGMKFCPNFGELKKKPFPKF